MLGAAGLTQTSQLHEGTKLLIPSVESDEQDLADIAAMSSLTDEVGYRHWTCVNNPSSLLYNTRTRTHTHTHTRTRTHTHISLL